MTTDNVKLRKAKIGKNDEFYTKYSDIENELQHYKSYFKNKIVYCNCDSVESGFTKYFTDNFSKLKLKLLICTTIKSKDKYIYDGKNKRIETLKEFGDFRSPECIDILKTADIVVTNPPFSLFREFVNTLTKYDKDFIIIGSQHAMTNKYLFSLFQNHKIKEGFSSRKGVTEFQIPKENILETHDNKNSRIDFDGNKYVKLAGIRWFTNLNVNTNERVEFVKTYTPEEYPKYDNYDAINVKRVNLIPSDYYGVMGVPLTFMDKYCPEQFEIIGLDMYVEDNPNYGKGRFKLNGKETFARILIKRKL